MTDDIGVARRVAARARRGVVTQRRMSSSEEDALIRAFIATDETLTAVRDALPDVLAELETHRANAIASMSLHDADATP